MKTTPNKIYTIKELRTMPDKAFEILCATRIMGWYQKTMTFEYEGIDNEIEHWWIDPKQKTDEHTGFVYDVESFKPYRNYGAYKELLTGFFNDWHDGFHCASQSLCALLGVDGQDSIDVAGQIMLTDLKTNSMAIILGHQSWYLED